MTQPTLLCSPCGVPRSVTDRGHASRRLSALAAQFGVVAQLWTITVVSMQICLICAGI